MEPLEGAVLKDGWWRYEPMPPPRQSLVLAASGATGAGWSACGGGSCITIGAEAEEPVVLKACQK
jgi:hypothetical protein